MGYIINVSLVDFFSKRPVCKIIREARLTACLVFKATVRRAALKDGGTSWQLQEPFCFMDNMHYIMRGTLRTGKPNDFSCAVGMHAFIHVFFQAVCETLPM